jgi:hypothetical protein
VRQLAAAVCRCKSATIPRYNNVMRHLVDIGIHAEKEVIQ